MRVHHTNGTSPVAQRWVCKDCDALVESARIDRANQYHMPVSDRLLIDMTSLDLYDIEWPDEGKTTSIIHASV